MASAVNFACAPPRGAVAAPGRRAASRPLAVRAVASEAPLGVPPSVQRPSPVVYSKLDKQHRLTPERLELVQSMGQFAEEKVLPVLHPVDKLWQPQDFLPDPESPDFEDQVAELRARAKDLPDEYFVVLVGDMITEEALPTYMAMINTLDGVRDDTGAADHPWARWTRQWVAEENRHGDLLNKYCWLTGRVNMRAVEVTINNLIKSGMNPQTDNNPYLGFVYTSFQERATKYSHGNTARLAAEHGDKNLSKICGLIASDEGRHEIAYTRIVDEFFRLDPEGAVAAYANMMRKQITMPAHLMDDMGHGDANPGRNLFADFSAVAEKIDVYDAEDYCRILEHLNARWKVDERQVSGQAAADQEYVLGLPQRFRKLAEKTAAKRKRVARRPVAFSWISGREIMV